MGDGSDVVIRVTSTTTRLQEHPGVLTETQGKTLAANVAAERRAREHAARAGATSAVVGGTLAHARCPAYDYRVDRDDRYASSYKDALMAGAISPAAIGSRAGGAEAPRI